MGGGGRGRGRGAGRRNDPNDVCTYEYMKKKTYPRKKEYALLKVN
jgi:hypothetical protein